MILIKNKIRKKHCKDSCPLLMGLLFIVIRNSNNISFMQMVHKFQVTILPLLTTNLKLFVPKKSISSTIIYFVHILHK